MKKEEENILKALNKMIIEFKKMSKGINIEQLPYLSISLDNLIAVTEQYRKDFKMYFKTKK